MPLTRRIRRRRTSRVAAARLRRRRRVKGALTLLEREGSIGVPPVSGSIVRKYTWGLDLAGPNGAVGQGSAVGKAPPCPPSKVPAASPACWPCRPPGPVPEVGTWTPCTSKRRAATSASSWRGQRASAARRATPGTLAPHCALSPQGRGVAERPTPTGGSCPPAGHGRQRVMAVGRSRPPSGHVRRRGRAAGVSRLRAGRGLTVSLRSRARSVCRSGPQSRSCWTGRCGPWSCAAGSARSRGRSWGRARSSSPSAGRSGRGWPARR